MGGKGGGGEGEGLGESRAAVAETNSSCVVGIHMSHSSALVHVRGINVTNTCCLWEIGTSSLSYDSQSHKVLCTRVCVCGVGWGGVGLVGGGR